MTDTKEPRRHLRRDLRDLHGKTWELELLISGAVIFGLLQLPPLLDGAFARMEPRLSDAMRAPGFLLYYYVKLSTLTLLMSFVFHLVCRAFWVGMVGLDSVFPRGIRWSASNAGPVGRAFYRKRLPTVKRLALTADAVSSVIFSVAWAMVGIFVGSALAAVAVAGIAFAISHLLLEGEHMGPITWVLIVLAVGPSVVASLVDRFLGDRIDPDGRAAGFVRAGLAVGYWVILQPLHAPVFSTLATNLKTSWVSAATAVGSFTIVGVFFVSLLAGRGVLSSDASPWLPRKAAAGVVLNLHYDDARNGAVHPAVPTVPSYVTEGPYLRIFLPWRSDRDDADLRTVCPDAPAVAEPGLRIVGPRDAPPDPAAVREVLACAARLWSLRLDGEPLAPELVVFEHPETGVPGLAAFLPVDELARGPHLLEIRRNDFGEDAEEESEPRRWEIPFLR